MANESATLAVSEGRIERAILIVRDQRVILDVELAELYGVPTKALNQAFKRNKERFPPDFAFRLTVAERDEVVTICDHLANLKFSRVTPNAFTEHGAIMAANVLNSDRAIAMSVMVVGTFIRLRDRMVQQEEMAKALRQIERRVSQHDEQLLAHVRRLRDISMPPSHRRNRRIGYNAEKDNVTKE